MEDGRWEMENGRWKMPASPAGGVNGNLVINNDQ